MVSRDISLVESVLKRIVRKLGLSSHLPVGDRIKSWDVMQTIELLSKSENKDVRILDIGAYCSELPVSLSILGFQNVHAIDLNPNIKAMPRNGQVKYAIGDFLATQYKAASFDVVTAVSVIEHGYQPERLFAEMGRLLISGGRFIASFDYWPEKINTRDTQFFGMSWLIFSKQEVQEMIEAAALHGLVPDGELSFDAKDKPIQCLGFDYTFAWIVFRKI